MATIHFLDDRLISQIAAGEVVERPASVVKELIENALDAGSTRIRVELEAGGKRRIVVADDGRGMDRDDALLAFDRHATSKIARFEDLEQVATLGFRGEALASIAAVSRVELRTAVSPGHGHKVRIEGGRVVRDEPIAHPRGSRFEIASLFYNVPARRKFLKRPQTELRRSLEVVQGYALAHPTVAFELVHGGRTLLDAAPSEADGEGLRRRIGEVFGGALADELVEIPLELIGEREAISGFVGNRETTRGRRLFTFVNRRLVRDRAVLARFYKAVRGEWKGDDYPALFLFLDLDPREVDVNVHPQKAEVRFRDPRFIDRVEDALRATLAEARGEEPAPLRQPEGPWPAPTAWQGLGGLPGGPESGPRAAAAGEVRETPRPYDPSPQGSVGFPSPTPGGERIAQASFAPQRPATVPLSGRSGEVRPFRLLGQYKGTLLLLEGPDGLYLIDQHVAHERILYERLRRSLEAESSAGQRLVTPPLLELDAAGALRLRELAEALEPCGFQLAPMSGNTVAMTAIPAMLTVEQAEGMLQTLATDPGDSDEAGDAAELRRRLLDALAADMACKAAVKMHHPLTVEEMQRLVTELFEAEQPYACPHGRPVVLRMNDAELERRFGRR